MIGFGTKVGHEADGIVTEVELLDVGQTHEDGGDGAESVLVTNEILETVTVDQIGRQIRDFVLGQVQALQILKLA